MRGRRRGRGDSRGEGGEGDKGVAKGKRNKPGELREGGGEGSEKKM